MARHRRRLGSTWTVLVPVIALLAGLMFGVSARTSGGSDLRTDRADLAQLVRDRERRVAAAEAQRQTLQDQVTALQTSIASGDAAVGAAQQAADAEAPAAGLTAVHGPGLLVVLDDAPLGPDGALPPGAAPDDVVIHQSDVQAIVNALWAAGAEALVIMGERIISTSAVRCVGNTLLLQGRTYSPPFRIAAIGDQSAMEESLETAPGVDPFLDAVQAYGLGYDVSRRSDILAPAYDGQLGVGLAVAVP